jgi:phospholipase/carboxylesterase
MALSCYLPIASMVAAERSEGNKSVPLFMAHGRFDDVIPIQRAQASREALEKMSYKVEWHEYPMPHSVCAEEIADISAFLSRVF